MTHTPGPWYAVYNGHYIDIKTSDDIYAPSVADVCESKFLRDGDNSEANAALIAAAPDLLTTGKHLALKLAAVYREVGVKPSECQAIRDFMLSVAKAEGRS